MTTRRLQAVIELQKDAAVLSSIVRESQHYWFDIEYDPLFRSAVIKGQQQHAEGYAQVRSLLGTDAD